MLLYPQNSPLSGSRLGLLLSCKHKLLFLNKRKDDSENRAKSPEDTDESHGELFSGLES